MSSSPAINYSKRAARRSFKNIDRKWSFGSIRIRPTSFKPCKVRVHEGMSCSSVWSTKYRNLLSIGTIAIDDTISWKFNLGKNVCTNIYVDFQHSYYFTFRYSLKHSKIISSWKKFWELTSIAIWSMPLRKNSNVKV